MRNDQGNARYFAHKIVNARFYFHRQRAQGFCLTGAKPLDFALHRAER